MLTVYGFWSKLPDSVGGDPPPPISANPVTASLDCVASVEAHFPGVARPAIGSAIGLKIDSSSNPATATWVTCWHVVKDSPDVRLRFQDQLFQVRVLKTSKAKDQALLLTNLPKLLKTPKIAKKDPVVGDSVWARGNPYGYEGTLTRGIISAYPRTIEMPSGYSLENIIQFDAAINPGSSGGGLFAEDGSLVGMAVAIYSGGHGIAFAIRSKDLWEEIHRDP